MKIIILFGEPATGKYTIGNMLAKKLDYAFIHQHELYDLCCKLYPNSQYKSFKLFSKLLITTIDDLHKNKHQHIIFTFVWIYNIKYMNVFISKWVQFLHFHKFNIIFIELYASLNLRIKRNKLPERIQIKPSKGNIETTEKQLIHLNSTLSKSKNRTKEFKDIIKNGYYFQVNTSYNQPNEVTDAIIDAMQKLG